MKPCGELTSLELAALLEERPPEATLCAMADQLKGAVVKDVQRVIEHATMLGEHQWSGAKTKVRAWTARAHARAYQNDFEGAIEDLHEATSLAESAHLPEELPGVLLAMVQPLARLGRLADAKSAAQQAISLAQQGLAKHDETAPPKAIDHSQMLRMIGAKAQGNLGGVLMMLGEPAEAIECYQRALEVLGTDAIVRAMLVSNRAEALLELDRFDEASLSFAEATKSFRDGGHLHGAAIAQGNQADLLSRMGRVDDAVALFESARRELSRLQASGDANRLLAEQAEALFASGAARASVPLFEESLPKLLEAGLARERTRGLLALGLARLRLRQLSKAREALDEAIAQAELVGAAAVKAEAQLAIGELEASEGNFQRGMEQLALAADGLKDRPARLAAVRAVQAMTQMTANDPRGAMHSLEQGFASIVGMDAGVLRARLGLVQGLCLRKLGDLGASKLALFQAIEHAERFRGSIAAEQLRTSYLESAHRLYTETMWAVMSSAAKEQVGLEDSTAQEAFDLSERLRQRTLLDQLMAAQGSTEVASKVPALTHQFEDQAGDTTAGGWLAEVSREEAAYLQQLNAMYAQLGPAGRGALAGKNLQGAQRLRRLEQSAAACRLAVESQGTTRRKHVAGQPMSLQAFAERLPNACSVINFILDGDVLSAQVITNQSSTLVRCIAQLADVQALNRRFELALSRAMRMPEAVHSCQNLAGQIRKICLDRLEDHLVGTSELVIVPAGPLHSAPLVAAGVLADVTQTDHSAARSATRFESLAAGCTLAAVASRSEILADHSVRSKPAALLVGMSDAIAPRMEDEVRAIRHVWPDASVLCGREATSTRVLADLPQADLVHLACHAVFDPEFPGSSRLCFADRWVTTRELATRLKPGAVVVLAGCNTGRSGETDGEDRSGFVRALIAGGASAVLTSQWPLHDSSALALFEAWHKGLAEWLSAEKPADPCINSCTSSLILAKNLRKIQTDAFHRGDPFYQWGGLSLTKGL